MVVGECSLFHLHFVTSWLVASFVREFECCRSAHGSKTLRCASGTLFAYRLFEVKNTFPWALFELDFSRQISHQKKNPNG